MAFTEKDMQAQEEQLSALKDELSRLNQKFDAQLKGMGLTEDDLKQQEEMTPEVEALVAKAKEPAQGTPRTCHFPHYIPGILAGETARRREAE